MAAHCIPLEKRFWSKVYKREGDDACWTWCGATSSKGYGHIKVDDKDVSAHVVSWFLAYKEWPAKHVLHTCDETRCVRPKHLFQGTQQDNMDDMHKKGRGRIFQFETRLDDLDRAKIKANPDGLTQRELGVQFGVTQGHISKVQNDH